MNIVSRAAWKAEPPRLLPGQTIPEMRLPAKALYVHHTVSQVSNQPSVDVRAVQQIAFSRNFAEISYNYLVVVDGTVFEGRGFNVGAHTAGVNSTSFGVALIGDYTRRVVTDAQVDSIRQLVAWLQAQGALSPGLYPTGGHRNAPGANTQCPGEFAMRRLPEMRAPWLGIPDPPAPDLGSRLMADAPVLRRGATGPQVKILQALLTVHAGDLTGPCGEFIDGDFGPRTERALAGWQARTSLTARGVCDAPTWVWLVGVA